MSEDKKSYTLESFQAEREKLQKEAKERFEKQELERKQMGDSLLTFLRKILEEDIKQFFSIYTIEGDIERNLSMIALSYLLKEDIDYLDHLKIDDFINIKTENKLQEHLLTPSKSKCLIFCRSKNSKLQRTS